VLTGVAKAALFLCVHETVFPCLIFLRVTGVVDSRVIKKINVVLEDCFENAETVRKLTVQL